MQVWNMLHAARWKYRTQKWRTNSPSAHHCTNLSGCIFETKACIDNRKNLLNINICSTCPHNMANFGPLAAEISSGVSGTPANFNGFRVLLSLLQRRRSPEANQTFTMFGHRLLGLYTMYTFSGALTPWRNFARCKIHFTSKSCVLLYWQRYCTALQQPASAKLCGVVQGMELGNFHRGRHLYSAGRPSVHQPTFWSFSSSVCSIISRRWRRSHYAQLCYTCGWVKNNFDARSELNSTSTAINRCWTIITCILTRY